MDIQKRIKRLDDEHIAFRKKVSEYEWDYQDMRREAKKCFRANERMDIIFFVAIVLIPSPHMN